ncbi:hypothetical protein Leryth_025475 [Lithospermum erythrorhizon]|nr:hypothetical protein Leryth_025475 [Lithospermum erythrorhizon]
MYININKILVCATMLLEKNKPYLVMIIVQVIYAGMALLSKVAVAQGMNTYVFVTYRLTFATISLAPFALFLEKKNADPLTYNILWKTFLVSFFGVTLSLNLYCVALKYTTATLAAATTNTIPAITFVIASILRVESVSITQRHGMAKVLGSTLSVSGALVFAFVKGPLIDFLNLSKRTTHYNESSVGSGMELVKGALVMLAANTFWSLWLIMQAPLMRQYPSTLRLTTLQCLFSCVQSAVWAIAVERHITSWKLG